MKVEVGKFYKNRIGEKVQAVRYGNGSDIVLLSNGHCVFTETGNANYEHNGPCDTDLIEEWKEPEVKEPKFKVGDRVRWNNPDLTSDQWQDFKIEQIDDRGKYFGTDSKSGYGGFSPSWDIELVEAAKPEITVGSRWTSIGKVSNIITVVHVNDKYVAFEHDGRETIGSTTVDRFHQFYAPYVEPPKSLVGYVGVFKSKDDGEIWFSVVGHSKEVIVKAADAYKEECDLITIKKVEWTEGE